LQLGNFELPKTMFLSKWMTARDVAKGGSPATGVVVVTTVSFPTLRGLAFVPAFVFWSESETVCVPWLADATAVMPSAPTNVAAHMSATLRMDVLPKGCEGVLVDWTINTEQRPKVSVIGRCYRQRPMRAPVDT